MRLMGHAGCLFHGLSFRFLFLIHPAVAVAVKVCMLLFVVVDVVVAAAAGGKYFVTTEHGSELLEL